MNLANWIFLFLFCYDKEFSVQSFVLPFTHILFHLDLDIMIDIFLLFRFEIILFAIKVMIRRKIKF